MKRKIRRFESGIATKGIVKYNFDFFPRMSLKEKDKVEYHGERYIFQFPNGWGASVIRHYGAYCDLNIMMPLEKLKEYKPKELRTYEIGLLDKNGWLCSLKNWKWFNMEVEGYLDYTMINTILKEIEKL